MSLIDVAIKDNHIPPVTWCGRSKGRNLAYIKETKTLLIEESGSVYVFNVSALGAPIAKAVCGMLGWVFVSREENQGDLLRIETTVRDLVNINHGDEKKILEAYITECDRFMQPFEKSHKSTFAPALF